MLIKLKCKLRYVNTGFIKIYSIRSRKCNALAIDLYRNKIKIMYAIYHYMKKEVTKIVDGNN
jgi:hypothetical protein